MVFWFDAHAIILDVENWFVFTGGGADLNKRTFLVSHVFGGIADQVFEDFTQANMVTIECRQVSSDLHLNAPRTDLGIHTFDSILDQSKSVYFNRRVDETSNTGKFEQVPEQGIHFVCGTCYTMEVALDAVGAVLIHIFFKQTRKAFDRNQRTAQIM